MKSNFNDCLNRLLKDEGGYTNDPNDSGGPTNYGITIFDVQKYINKNATAQDVRNLSLDQAKSIYKSKYWDTLGCDGLSSGVDYSVFDYGVNSGVARSRRILNKFSNLKGVELVDAINNERMEFLKALAVSQPKNQKFLRGWLNRVTRVKAYSEQLAKKDNTSGPIAGSIVAAGAAGAATHHTVLGYIQAHPYIIVAGVAATAIVIGFIVHYIRNKGK